MQPEKKETLFEIYKKDFKSELETIANDVISQMNAALEDDIPDWEWSKLLNSPEFNAVQEDPYFQKQLIYFLEENQLEDRILHCLQRKIGRRQTADSSISRVLWLTGIITGLSFLVFVLLLITDLFLPIEIFGVASSILFPAMLVLLLYYKSIQLNPTIIILISYLSFFLLFFILFCFNLYSSSYEIYTYLLCTTCSSFFIFILTLPICLIQNIIAHFQK